MAAQYCWRICRQILRSGVRIANRSSLRSHFQISLHEQCSVSLSCSVFPHSWVRSASLLSWSLPRNAASLRWCPSWQPLRSLDPSTRGSAGTTSSGAVRVRKLSSCPHLLQTQHHYPCIELPPMTIEVFLWPVNLEMCCLLLPSTPADLSCLEIPRLYIIGGSVMIPDPIFKNRLFSPGVTTIISLRPPPKSCVQEEGGSVIITSWVGMALLTLNYGVPILTYSITIDANFFCLFFGTFLLASWLFI